MTLKKAQDFSPKNYNLLKQIIHDRRKWNSLRGEKKIVNSKSILKNSKIILLDKPLHH